MIDIKSLGAKGDSITDDSVVFNEAFANYREIYIPNGEYLVADTLKIHSNIRIVAEKNAHILRKEHTQTGRYDFLLTNADVEN